MLLLCAAVVAVVACSSSSSNNRMVLCASAQFAPENRLDMMPNATGGVFACVGACGQSLSEYQGDTYCSSSSGDWASGDGSLCDNDGTHGAIGSWNVSRAQDMTYSELDQLNVRRVLIVIVPHILSTFFSENAWYCMVPIS